jgi:geranylgeranyl diphosphate synthase type I
MNKFSGAEADIRAFQRKLAECKKAIDAEINEYAEHARKNSAKFYGPHVQAETDAFLSILTRGGKRIRGALVGVGYEMSGGTDRNMIIRAARAIEMLHAHFLIIDDIQDRSIVRRGEPAAHVMLAEYHRRHMLAGDAEHFGISIALNAAISGAAAAQMLLANVDADPQLKLNAIGITNRTMAVTAHGQTGDIMNEVVAEVSDEDIERVLEWKTADYSILNPLHVGMVLAGADCHATDAITPYAKHTGKAFQITDDVLSTFGSKDESGKDPMDDIREGKQTVLTVYALEHGKKADVAFLRKMLGNRDLTNPEFEKCKAILESSRARAHAEARAKFHIEEALKSLDKEARRWAPEGAQFLRGLARYLLVRDS